MILYTGFNYVTIEKVVDLGPIKINAEKNHPIQWSLVIGLVLLVGGIMIVSSDKEKGQIFSFVYTFQVWLSTFLLVASIQEIWAGIGLVTSTGFAGTPGRII